MFDLAPPLVSSAAGGGDLTLLPLFRERFGIDLLRKERFLYKISCDFDPAGPFSHPIWAICDAAKLEELVPGRSIWASMFISQPPCPALLLNVRNAEWGRVYMTVWDKRGVTLGLIAEVLRKVFRQTGSEGGQWARKDSLGVIVAFRFMKTC